MKGLEKEKNIYMGTKKQEVRNLMREDCCYISKRGDRPIEEYNYYVNACWEYNNIPPMNKAKKRDYLSRLLGSCGEGCTINSPFQCDYGFNIHLGNNVFINYGCTMLSSSPVYLGDNVKVAPNVIFACAGHSIHPKERSGEKDIQTSGSIKVKENVWIGANVTILANVTIGKNSVIGAGSVVTKDIPANVVAVGSPCRVVRKIEERDKIEHLRGIRKEKI